MNVAQVSDLTFPVVEKSDHVINQSAWHQEASFAEVSEDRKVDWSGKLGVQSMYDRLWNESRRFVVQRTFAEPKRRVTMLRR